VAILGAARIALVLNPEELFCGPHLRDPALF
jgi:hypothetical protein